MAEGKWRDTELYHHDAENSPHASFFLLHASSGCPHPSPCVDSHHTPARKHRLTTHETHTHTSAVCVFVAGGCDGSIWSYGLLSCHCCEWVDGSLLCGVVFCLRSRSVNLQPVCINSTLAVVYGCKGCATGDFHLSASNDISDRLMWFKRPIKWALWIPTSRNTLPL